MTPLYDPIAIARQFLYLREAQTKGQNRGLRVEAIQHWSGGQFGDSWCMEFVWLVLDICYQGQCPFDRQQSTEAFLQLAATRGWIVTAPQIGDIVLSVASAGQAHHVGLVTDISPLASIAGNTSADGTSSNGDRVAEHAITPDLKVFVRIPQE